MELPTLSQEVATALDEAVDISDWIAHAHPGQINQTRATMVAGPYYGICLEHREAMLLLIRHGCRTSAYALFRSFYEACMRGLWAERCLGESELAQLVATKSVPTLEKIVKQIDKATKGSQYSAFKAKSWAAMCDYAHGGLLQLERWASADEIAPQHPDCEVIELLRMLNFFGLIAVWGVARLAHAPTEQHEAKVLSYAAAIGAASTSRPSAI